MLPAMSNQEEKLLKNKAIG